MKGDGVATARPSGVVASSRRNWGLVLIVGAAALLIRSYRVDANEPYWDEFFQISAAVGSDLLNPIGSGLVPFTQEDFWKADTVHNVLHVANSTFDPPVFYLLLHEWIGAFGTSDLVARLPSVVFGVGLVGLTFVLARRLVGTQAAAWAAILCSVNPLMVFFSREARGHMLAAFGSTLATILLVRILESDQAPTGLLLAYGLCVSGTLLTHHMTIIVFAAHGVIALRRPRKAARLIGPFALAGLSLIGWWVLAGDEALESLSRIQAAHLALARLGDGGPGYLFVTSAHTMFAGLTKICCEMAGMDFQAFLVSHGYRLRVAALALCGPLYLMVQGCRRRPEDGRINGGSLLTLLVVVPLVVLAALAVWVGHTLPLRAHYAVFAAPYVTIAIAAGVQRLEESTGRARFVLCLLTVAQFAGSAYGLKRIYTDQILWERPPNQFVILARELAQAAAPSDVVVFPSWADARFTNLYLPRERLIEQKVTPPGIDDRVEIAFGFAKRQVGVAPAREVVVLDEGGKIRMRFREPRYW